MKQYFNLVVLFLFFMSAFSFTLSQEIHPRVKTKIFHAPKSKIYNQKASSSEPTYKIGNNTYKRGETYKNGTPMVKRSESAKKRYLKNLGYKKAPKGYDVDHIIPLS